MVYNDSIKGGELMSKTMIIMIGLQASRNRQQPVTKNEQGVILVSGCTPRLFSMIAGGNVSDITPEQFMLEVLMGERYEKIAA